MSAWREKETENWLEKISKILIEEGDPPSIWEEEEFSEQEHPTEGKHPGLLMRKGKCTRDHSSTVERTHALMFYLQSFLLTAYHLRQLFSLSLTARHPCQCLGADLFIYLFNLQTCPVIKPK